LTFALLLLLLLLINQLKNTHFIYFFLFLLPPFTLLLPYPTHSFFTLFYFFFLMLRRLTPFRLLARTMSSTSSSATKVPIGDVVGGPFTASIIKKINDNFQPSHFAIYNDSHKHAHHASMRGSTNTIESHFRLEIVSESFQGKSQPIRHRQVYALLKEEMKAANGVHALQLQTKTPTEWEKLQQQE
jgi:BolA protein